MYKENLEFADKTWIRMKCHESLSFYGASFNKSFVGEFGEDLQSFCHVSSLDSILYYEIIVESGFVELLSAVYDRINK